MRILLLYCFVLSLPLVAWCENALLSGVGNVYLVEKHRDWGIYTAVQEGQRFCYLLSLPIKSSEEVLSGDAAIMVTQVSEVFDEVSITFGVKYGNRPVVLSVDNKIFYSLPIIDDQVAWAENAETDAALLQALKKGFSVSAVGYTEDIKKMENVYSLMGFTKSYDRMKQICKSGN